ncbi:hypothetical protein AURDEDRAFT_117005 [Auricularia subglabra TFB-10046 SS5]|nr:hypothetical protein AURDEDRAFT_117005 [Auricularia subglabra TFB-10046 SS5]
MRVSFVAAALASAALVFAQDESPVPGLPVCVFKCTDESAKASGCGSYLNATCLCTSTDFQAAAGKCLAACTTEEQATALTFQKATCDALAAGGNNGTDTPAPSNTGSETAPAPTETDPPNAAGRALALNGAAAVAAVVALVFAA